VIVVDTNVIVYYYVTGQHTGLVSRLLQFDSAWIVPPLWRSEFRSAISQYVRHNILTLQQAILIVNKAERRFQSQEMAIASASVLALTAQSQCSSYDCEHIALAQQMRVSLITFDKKVLREFPSTAVLPEQYINTRRQ
jgi:predicted nucleic acid-binding protein